MRAVHLAELLRKEVVDRLADQLAMVVTEQLLYLAVGKEDLAVLVGHDDAVGRGIEQDRARPRW